MNFKRGLFPFIDTLLDERVLIGTGRDCSESLWPLAYSQLADIVHQIIYLFSRNMHDSTLSISIHTTCAQLMLSHVEPIFEKGVDQQSMDEAQMLMGRILDTFVEKFSTFKRTIPQLLEEGGLGKDRVEEGGLGKDWVTLRAKLRPSVQSTLVFKLDYKLKSIIWSTTHAHVPRTQGMNPQALASQSSAPKGFKGMRENEVCKASGVLRSGVHYLALFKEKDQEKEIMLNIFSQILAVMEPRDIMDMFSLCMPELFKCMINKNQQLVQIFGALLQASKVYKPFADILINLLVSSKLDVVKNIASDASKLVLHQFGCIFGAVTKTPSDFERILQQHMPYPWGGKALQIQKLGCRHRGFLNEPLTLACKDYPEHALGLVLTSHPSTPFLVPLEKFIKVDVAAVNPRNHSTYIYYRKQALKFLRVCLLSQRNLHNCVTDVGPGRLSTLLHSSVECHRNESEQIKADLEVQTKTHIMAVKSIFKTLLQHVQTSGSDLCDSDSFHIQMIRTMLSFLRHIPLFLLLLLSWTSCCSAATAEVTNLLGFCDKQQQCLSVDRPADRSLLHYPEPIEPMLIVSRAGTIFVMHQSGKPICSFSSMWLLAVFLVVVVVCVFMRFSLKGKSLEKKRKKKGKRNVNEQTDTKSVPSALESGKDATINEQIDTKSGLCASASGKDGIINEHTEKSQFLMHQDHETVM